MGGPDPDTAISDQVARAARLAYGRLVAWLAVRFGNLADAEDALADALEAALRVWPRMGVPQSPEAWLLTAARRRLLDRKRHAQTALRHEETLVILSEERMDQMVEAIPDERLKLMFACTHPAIDPGVRAPLMMQVVLGLDARRIGNAFLVPPGTMGVRLARAKAKIAAAGIPFDIPAPAEVGQRLADVLDAVYAGYTLGHDGLTGDDARPAELAIEALWLVSVICRLVPEADEAHGLFALMLFGMARRAARRDAEGRYVPLEAQDRRLWDQGLLADADLALRNARRGGTLGRYQIEAAIEALQMDGLKKGRIDRDGLLALYRGLEVIAPTLGVICGRIAAQAGVEGAAAGLAALDALTDARRLQYQPYWALRGHLCESAGDAAAAVAAYQKAAALTEAGPRHDWILAKAQRLHAH